MSHLEVEILAPDRPIAEVSSTAVTIPGVKGYLTVLPDHAAMVSEVDVGELIVAKSSGELKYFISGGYVEVEDNKLKVLADVIEIPEDIDVERAKKAYDRALERLGLKSSDVDRARAQSALRRAQSRMLIAKAIGALAKSL